jgi:hypothetical protein
MSSLTTTVKTNNVPSAYLTNDGEPAPKEEKPVEKPAEERTKSIRDRVQRLFA